MFRVPTNDKLVSFLVQKKKANKQVSNDTVSECTCYLQGMKRAEGPYNVKPEK